MTIGDAWALVDAGQIGAEHRQWVSVADGLIFPFISLAERREALVECAEHVTLMNFIVELPNGYKSLIDDRNFLRTKLADKATCLRQCESHVLNLLQRQDGGVRQNRTLAERRNIYLATATP
jgi:hypothetical protein